MLIYFKVGNYKSIKEPVVINFTATAINEHRASNVIRRGKDELLKTILLYGPNASGKSKILDALVFFRWSVLNSAADRLSHQQISTEPFALNTTTQEQRSFFEAEFIIQKTKYRYGFEADKEAVRKEWLMEVKATTSQVLFLRIEQEFKVENGFAEAKGLEKRTRRSALFLSVAATWNVPKAEGIVDWFDSIYTINGMMDNAYTTMTTSMLKERSYNEMINELMLQADLGINSIHALDMPEQVKENILKTAPPELLEEYKERLSKDRMAVFAMHSVFNDQHQIENEIPFSMDGVESEGTRKLFNLAGVFVQAATSGRLVIIDEFDARLHTLLVKAIIRLFNNVALTSGAQLLGVSHDTALLDKDLLRRDQIYFVEKDNYGATKVSTLVEFKPRKESPYFKNYLEGKYGAIPFISNLETSFQHAQEK